MFVEDVLKYKDLNYYSEQDVERIVQNSSRQRFQTVVDEATWKLKVRANQGHTLEVRTVLYRSTYVNYMLHLGEIASNPHM